MTDNTNNHDTFSQNVHPADMGTSDADSAVAKLADELLTTQSTWLDTVSDDEVFEKAKALATDFMQHIVRSSNGEDIDTELGVYTDTALTQKTVLYSSACDMTILLSLSVEYEADAGEEGEVAEDAFFEQTHSMMDVLSAATNDEHCTTIITAHFIKGMPPDVSFDGEPDYISLPDGAYKGRFDATKTSPFNYMADDAARGNLAIATYLTGDSGRANEAGVDEGIASGLKGNINPGDVDTMRIWLRSATEWEETPGAFHRQIGAAGTKGTILSGDSEV